MNREELKELAKTCAEFRKGIGKTQRQMADDLGVPVGNISHFENGRSSNLVYLLWYLQHGMKVGEDGKET